MEKYLSVPEFAKRLGISRIAVFKKIKKRALPAIRIGRNWCILDSYIEKYKNLSSKKPKENSRSIFPSSSKTTEEKKQDLRLPKKDSIESMGWD